MTVINNPIQSLFKDAGSFIHGAGERLFEAYEYAPPLYILKRHISQVTRTLGLCSFGIMFFLITVYQELILENDNSFLNKSFSLCLTGSIFIFSVNRITEDIFSVFREWEIRKLTKDQSKEFVVLHCLPYHDHNSSFTNIGRNKIRALKNLGRTHSIVHMIVKNLKDINEAIDKIKKKGQKITTLWLNGHGTSESMQLNSSNIVIGEAFPLNLEECIHSVHFSKLEPNADIVLSGCSLGKENLESINFAEWVQIYAGPHRKVHAPFASLISDWDIFNPISRKWTFYGVPRLRLPLTFNITAKISHEAAIQKLRSLHHSKKKSL
ncbi:MAG: hypothetical protein K1000chlam3_00008 [Chlamydiae bacterium]|nr:hypothetical protein [Chlamydiota bacterium]